MVLGQRASFLLGVVPTRGMDYGWFDLGMADLVIGVSSGILEKKHAFLQEITMGDRCMRHLYVLPTAHGIVDFCEQN